LIKHGKISKNIKIKKGNEMAISLIGLLAAAMGIAIASIISMLWRKKTEKTDEPKYDERTQKVGCRAAQATIIVLMGVLGIIGWGDILGVFKLETSMAVSLVFFALMISMFGFLRYYNSKEI
jgi:uncharacterized membrane protein